jgi:hypothetical protein
MPNGDDATSTVVAAFVVAAVAAAALAALLADEDTPHSPSASISLDFVQARFQTHYQIRSEGADYYLARCRFSVNSGFALMA